MKKIFATLACLLAVTACNTGTGDFTGAAKSEFIAEYEKRLGITSETHGTPLEMAPFSQKDIPRTLPSRESTFSDSGVALIVKHSQGYSKVTPLYELNVHRRYSASGRGKAVPISVKIDPPMKPNVSVSLPRSSYRALSTDNEYQFKGSFLSDSNREVAIRLAREVLMKTHCYGGAVTQNTDKPEFAQAFGKRARTASGQSILPGWAIHFRCSRWRER